ncbi:MAG TPA: glycosyltransferase family 39 protein [Methylomirabilota bacterium]|nr:glycosyltransferase family 39 protein [Methylomirabilota bacterium]
MSNFKKSPLFFLSIILIFGFVVRLYRFNNPIADWHSWRQADTSAVSRNFALSGFDLLHPRMDNISNVQSGLENPQGYFFAEFPIYNAVQAGLFKFVGILTLEEWGRVVTILSSTCSTLFLYLIVSRHSNKTLGLLAAFFYAFTPYNIYYGRIILADPSMVMAILGGIYFFDRWLDFERHPAKQSASRIFYSLLAILFTGAAFLLRPYAVFFVLPIVYLAFKKFGWRTFFQWQLWLFVIVSVIPLVWWRIWMTQFPEGIPANAWLLNGNGIRFHPAFFRWIFYERLTKLISGYLGIIIFVFGFLKVVKLKEWLFFLFFIVSSLAYVTVFATGNVQHDYYQILIMPSVAIFFAIGSYFLYHWSRKKLPVGKIVLAICLVSFFWFGWMQVKDYFNINNPSIIIAGEAVDHLTPKNAKIIANYNGDSSLLYQTKRKGWASFEKPIPDMIKMGASYLLLVNPTEKDMVFAKDYKLIVQTKDYLLFDLKQK